MGKLELSAFVRLKPGVTYEEVNRQLVQNKIINDKMEKSSDFKEVKPMVIPIRDVYYHTKPWFYFKTGDLQHTRLMILIRHTGHRIAAVNLNQLHHRPHPDAHPQHQHAKRCWEALSARSARDWCWKPCAPCCWAG